MAQGLQFASPRSNRMIIISEGPRQEQTPSGFLGCLFGTCSGEKPAREWRRRTGKARNPGIGVSSGKAPASAGSGWGALASLFCL